MALQIAPWRPNPHQPLPKTPELGNVSPPNMAEFFQNAIGNLLPTLAKSYSAVHGQIAQEKAGEAWRTAQLGQPGGAYGPATPTGGTTPPSTTSTPAEIKPLYSENPTAGNLQPHEAGFLNAVAAKESNGRYNVRYTPQGGTLFDNLDRHPGIFEKGPHGPSSAAGRYQFTKSTWDRVMGADTPFTPENQDIAALKLARTDYTTRTGRDLDADLQSEGFSPRIQAALRPTWASLGGKNTDAITGAYTSTAGSFKAPEVQTVQLPATGTGSFSGPPSRGRVAPLTAEESRAMPDQPRPGEAIPAGARVGTSVAPRPPARPGATGAADAPAPGARAASLETGAGTVTPPPAPVAGNTDVTEAYKQRLVQQYPTLRITSEYRSPEHNQRVGGAQNSQHTHGRAIDISTEGLTEAQQQAIVQDAVNNGARGIGHYGNSMHIDFRDGPAAAWGPNRSRTSLGQTPPWFQQAANGLLSSGGPGTPAPAAAGGAPGGFSVEGLQAALAQAPPALRAVFEQLASRVPGGLPTLMNQLGGMMQGGQQPPAGAATGPNPTPVAPQAPAQVAAAAPGVVTRTPPTERATAGGSNQAPLFQTPQMAAATTAASEPTLNMAQPGIPAADVPAPGATPVSLPAGEGGFVIPGSGQVVQPGTGADAGNLGPGPNEPARAPAGPASARPAGQGGTAPAGRPAGVPGLPGGPGGAGGTLNPAAFAGTGMPRGLQDAIGYAISGGHTQTANGLLAYAERAYGRDGKFSFIKGDDGTIYRTDQQGNIEPVVTSPQGQEFELIPPGHPERGRLGIDPRDPRTYKRSRKTGELTPISEPTKTEDKAAPVVDGMQWNPQTQRYDIPVGTTKPPEVKDGYQWNPQTGRYDIPVGSGQTEWRDATPDEIRERGYDPATTGGGMQISTKTGEVKFPAKTGGNTSVTVAPGEKKEEEKLGEARAAGQIELRTQADAGRRTIAQTAQMRDLLRRANTGALAKAGMTIGAIAQGLGLSDESLAALGINNKNEVASQQVIDAMTGQFLSGKLASGAFPTNNFSNVDRQFITQQLPSLSNTPIANALLLRGMELDAQRAIEKQRAWAAYRGKHGKDADFDAFRDEWDERLESTTGQLFVTVPSEEEALKLPKGTIVRIEQPDGSVVWAQRD